MVFQRAFLANLERTSPEFFLDSIGFDLEEHYDFYFSRQRRQAAAITRRLALLRAHRILQKLSGTHRYQLTKTGQRILTALLSARHCDIDQLTQMAA